MNTVLPLPGTRKDFHQHGPLILALIGFAAMYLPVYWWALNGIWQSEEQGHGLIVLAIVVWLFWQQHRRIVEVDASPAPLAGSVFFAVGLLLYIIGRALDVSILLFLSQLPVLLGVLLVLKGWSVVRVCWFPLLYLVFMVPLPGVLVDAMTGQLKQWVSLVAEELLYFSGYPIGRNGVMLTIGNYELLVADACSGLNSMFSLTALGLLFCYVMARKSISHNVLMIISILPIAFVANIVRVMILVLITYYMGDEAAQGFLHGMAGMVLMLVALVIFFALDFVLHSLISRPVVKPPAETAPNPP